MYQIDQSGRLEFTSQDTVISIANGSRRAILIKAKEKRQLQQIFRLMGKNKQFAVRTFVVMIFILIKRQLPSHLVIDNEYPGWEKQIITDLTLAFQRIGRDFNPSHVEFRSIGKSSNAHWHAYYVFKKRRKPNITVSAKEILNELFH